MLLLVQWPWWPKGIVIRVKLVFRVEFVSRYGL
jgi:hypothetical protein